MTFNVTVQTSASTSVLVPFTSAANAAIAQSALDASANVAASAGFLKYFSPPNVGGSVTLPTVPFFGGVVDTVPAALNFGIMDPKYTTLVNAGSGLVAAIGGVNTTLVSAASASTIFVNQSTAGQAYIGGGNNVLSNAFSISHLTAAVDGAPGGALGGSTLILDDRAGGGMDVSVGAGLLVALESGGSDSIMAQGGTVAILAHQGSTGLAGITTITAAASTDLWVGAQGAPVFINPGAGNAFIFQGTSGTENSATLFGGTKTIGGSAHTAAAYTGRTTVLGMNGYLESGSAGGSIMTTGTTAGAATLVAGGAGDILFVNGANDVADLGNSANVVMSASNVTTGGGVTAIFGSGSGQVFGAADGQNTFNFTGAGNYTVAGFHQSGTFLGSVYKDLATGPGGAGNITIVDFLPQQSAGGAIFDKFDLGSKTVTNLSTIEVGAAGSGIFNNVAVLSDGTTINFNNTFGTVHVQGTLIV
ncbi:hypothetical protein [Sphingomonas sp.]|uniref:hypothetical protein n=1 Tax=Sphingomonas sp. TaxID=28214 RepID=UPI0035B1937C